MTITTQPSAGSQGGHKFHIWLASNNTIVFDVIGAREQGTVSTNLHLDDARAIRDALIEALGEDVQPDDQDEDNTKAEENLDAAYQDARIEQLESQVSKILGAVIKLAELGNAMNNDIILLLERELEREDDTNGGYVPGIDVSHVASPDHVGVITEIMSTEVPYARQFKYVRVKYPNYDHAIQESPAYLEKR